jgi:hypothetical protein
MDRRQHLIGSLDTLLYQLHTLSFFLAPALLPLLARIAAQAHCRPRPDDAHSLRFYLALVLVLNVPSLWYHATRAPHDDRAVVLDFVGLGASLALPPRAALTAYSLRPLKASPCFPRRLHHFSPVRPHMHRLRDRPVVGT